MAFRLPRLPRDVAIADTKSGRPTPLFQRWWQSFIETIEGQEGTQDQMLTDIATALANAGIALTHANSVMPDIPPVTVLADYSGTILDGQLPRNIAAKRLNDTTDVTTSSTWSASTISGDATYTIGAATGVLNVTALTSSAVIEITSVFNTVTRSKRVLVSKALQDPPQSSSTTTAYDSSITATASDSYGSANAGPLTITCGASGNVVLTAPLSTSTTSAASQIAWGKWQVSAAGAGIWSDVDTEIEAAEPAEGDGSASTQLGSISVNQTATGLTPASDYDFQLLLRNNSGTATINYTGTATATTS